MMLCARARVCVYVFVCVLAFLGNCNFKTNAIAHARCPTTDTAHAPRSTTDTNTHSVTASSTSSSQGVFNVVFELGFHPTLRHRAPVEAGLGVLDGGQVELHSDKLAGSVEGCMCGLLVPRLFPDGKQTLNIHGGPVARERLDSDALEGRVAAAVLLPERDGAHGLGRLLYSGVAELPSLILVFLFISTLWRNAKGVLQRMQSLLLLRVVVKSCPAELMSGLTIIIVGLVIIVDLVR